MESAMSELSSQSRSNEGYLDETVKRALLEASVFRTESLPEFEWFSELQEFRKELYGRTKFSLNF